MQVLRRFRRRLSSAKKTVTTQKELTINQNCCRHELLPKKIPWVRQPRNRNGGAYCQGSTLLKKVYHLLPCESTGRQVPISKPAHFVEATAGVRVAVLPSGRGPCSFPTFILVIAHQLRVRNRSGSHHPPGCSPACLLPAMLLTLRSVVVAADVFGTAKQITFAGLGRQGWRSGPGRENGISRESTCPNRIWE